MGKWHVVGDRRFAGENQPSAREIHRAYLYFDSSSIKTRCKNQEVLQEALLVYNYDKSFT
ncbi:hypothetical protein Mapa_008638 [Marchantia paleacea]|nr:hypothetical protein Mapa_008638 [Marchantia paleacea]